MSTSINVLVRKIQSTMGDPSKTFVTDQDCYDWIYDGQREICKITECLTDTLATVTSNGTELYNLDIEIIKILRITLQGKKLQSTTIDILDQIDPDRGTIYPSGQGLPTHYYLDGGQLGLWPIPNVAGLPISIRARIIPSTIIGSGGVLDIPDYFSNDILRYCHIRGREKDENVEMLQLLMQDWALKLATGMDIANNPETSTYSSVTDIDQNLESFYQGIL